KFLTCHAGTLHVQSAPGGGLAFAKGTAAELWASHHALIRPAIHELLFDRAAAHPPPAFPAAALARGAIASPGDDAGAKAGEPTAGGGAVVWIDAIGTLYPPGVFAAGIPPGRLYVLRVKPAD